MIGVAVSGIPGRMINFAIPGEYVNIILNGRISALGREWTRVLRAGGRGILSGFDESDLPHVRGALQKAGVNTIDTRSENLWRAIVIEN